MTPAQAEALEGLKAGIEDLAFNLSVFFNELVRLEFPRDEALELTKEWMRGFFDFRRGHAAEGECDE